MRDPGQSREVGGRLNSPELARALLALTRHGVGVLVAEPGHVLGELLLGRPRRVGLAAGGELVLRLPGADLVLAERRTRLRRGEGGQDADDTDDDEADLKRAGVHGCYLLLLGYPTRGSVVKLILSYIVEYVNYS